MKLKKIMYIFLIFSIFLSLVYFALEIEKNQHTQLLLLNKEYPSIKEDQIANQMIELFKINYTKLYSRGKRPILRAQHAKTIVCLRAIFKIEPNLKEIFRYGIFKETRSYEAIIRFSSANEQIQSDNIPDIRGMSIKILRNNSIQPNQVQDFLTINHPVFPIRNPNDLLELMQVITKNGNPYPFAFPSINPIKWRWHEMYLLYQFYNQPIISPLKMNFWSATPYKLGPHAIKFMLKNRNENLPDQENKSGNWMTQDFADILRNNDLHFDFLIQLQTDPYKMPIEDASIEWDDQLSPFYKVASVTIPQQIINPAAQQTQCEELDFNPWHTSTDLKPIGGLNRVRKKVYDVMAHLRNKLNNIKQ